MSLVRPAPPKSFALSRANKMLGRIYSLALPAIFAEALANGVNQLEYLNPTIFWVSTFFLAAATIGVFVTQWFFPNHTTFWMGSVAFIALVLLVTWPLHFDTSQAVPESFQPWIWWTLGISAVAAGTTFRFVYGVAYLLIISILWAIAHLFFRGHSTAILHVVQESTFLFVFSSIVTAMVLALRWEAGKTDSANQRAISSAVERARIDAVELERLGIDALVHDSVLTTLLLASRAETSEQSASASNSAKEAIAKLLQARDDANTSEAVTVATFFQALEDRVLEASSEFSVIVNNSNDLPIPGDVASALFEATLQAVDNSLKHAGKPTKREVRLRGQKTGLKIVVSDDGVGFRPSRVPKNRLGISSSIAARVKGIGGRVFIRSSPGHGAQIVIEWGFDD